MKGLLNIKIYKSGILLKSWKWKAVAPNGRIIASGRGFNSRELCVDSVETLFGYVKGNSYFYE